MIPRYLLVNLRDGTQIVGCEEWTDMLPPMAGVTRLKPLFTSLAVNNHFEQRQIGGGLVFEIKRTKKTGQILYRTEFELRKPFLPLAVNDHLSSLHGLLSVPTSRITQIWSSIPWNERKLSLPDQLVDMTSQKLEALTADLPNLALDKAWVMGSLAYMPDKADPYDIDIAFLAPEREALTLRHRVASLRINYAQYRPRSDTFVFPFRLQMGDVWIDLFPCIDITINMGKQHPLMNSISWEVQGAPRKRKTVVTGVALSCYAFPIVKVEDHPKYLVIGSNAFRGAFIPGDVIECIAQRVRVLSPDGELTIDLVPDPWNNLVAWQEFIELARDEKWLFFDSNWIK